MKKIAAGADPLFAKKEQEKDVKDKKILPAPGSDKKPEEKKMPGA